MGDFSAKRIFLTAALLLSSLPALASIPSGRSQMRMVYDPVARRMIMFGGVTGLDNGTSKVYYLNDTWQWNGIRWTQLFPAHAPEGRSGQAMAYDSLRQRVLVFGGHGATVDLNDTWTFNGTDWSQINTPSAPPARFLHGGAYDSTRDRFVIFGGVQFSADGKSQTTLYDTWEFDGTTWRQIGGEGPHVAKPAMVYDEERQTMLMLGIDDAGAPLMYSYNAAAGTWTKLSPTTLPSCPNEGAMTFDSTRNVPVFTAGICTSTGTDNEVLEWDGTNWKKREFTKNSLRVASPALAYDPDRDALVMFGGATGSLAPVNLTYVFTSEGWNAFDDATMPGPRSLFAFVTDPVNKAIWLFGGISEVGQNEDFWRFQNGIWKVNKVTDTSPTDCSTPNGAYDIDRQRLVIVCASSGIFEWDGATWKKFESLRTAPAFRRFSSMAYDQTLKKTVLFGGFDAGSNYKNETWTWNGTEWTRVRDNPPPQRYLASMWWDPTLKKTVIYGGIGRLTSGDRVTRFDDMWAFDGSGWTQIKPAGGTPPARYGAQTAVDPRTGRVVLFGGLQLVTVPAVPPKTTPTETQAYADDMWTWNGSAWTKVTTLDGQPPARENGAMAYDPSLDTMVMYGGYAGHFLSDLWTLTGTSTWRVRPEIQGGGRRRAVGQ